MKIITLLPTKNEDWILESFLKNASIFSDHIIIADQMSNDGSREIIKKFHKVVLIDNKESGHSNKVRWQLLDAARDFDGENMVFCLDADEFILPIFFQNELPHLLGKLSPGFLFEFNWVQLWKSLFRYRCDGAWQKSYKPIAFWDDRKMDYKREFVINDHTTRVPGPGTGMVREEMFPLLHLQFVPWERAQIKQAWYRCVELIKGDRSPQRINNTYSITLDVPDTHLTPVPQRWLEGIELPKHLDALPPTWHLQQILDWFDQYGIGFFEPLQIWHVRQLHDEFVRRVGREPKAKTFHPIVVRANDIKNKILK